MFVTIETWNGRHIKLRALNLCLEAWLCWIIDKDLDILLSLSDIALLLYTSHSRLIVRIMHRVGQSMIANCDQRRQNGHPIEMGTIKRPELIELLIDTQIYSDEMSLYITLLMQCACIAERTAIWHFINVEARWHALLSVGHSMKFICNEVTVRCWIYRFSR